MTPKITTNELKVTFDYEAIQKNYRVYQLETSEKFIKSGAAFLDLAEDTFVRSIVFASGKKFYLMTNAKDVEKRMVFQAVQKYEGSEHLSIKELKVENIDSPILLQLFFNSLSNPEQDAYSYNNLTGKLLCYNSAWQKKDSDGNMIQLDCIEVKVTKETCLQLSAHRMTALSQKSRMQFGKRKIHDYPQYEIAYHHHTLKRVSKEKLNEPTNLIQKPIGNEKSSITFFDFSNYEEFASSKNGVLYNFMNLVKKQFSEYLSIEFVTYENPKILSVKKTELKLSKEMVQQQLLKTGINVIDEVQNSTSESFLQDLCQELQSRIPGVECSIGKRLSKRKVNIRYIHEKDYYGEEDPYQASTKEVVVQHITEENFQHDVNASVETILKELVIKHDLKQGKISLIDWGKYEFDSDWIFGIEIDEEYYFMKIHPDGTFDVEKMQYDLFNASEYNRYMDCFSVDGSVEGLVKDAAGNINIIKKTNMHTLPEIKEIGNALKKASETRKFSGEEWTRLLKIALLKADNQKVNDKLEEVISTLQEQKQYDKKDIFKSLKGNPLKKFVVDSIFEDEGILLFTYLRNKETREKYFSGVIDINYFQQSDTSARFCVGEIGEGMKEKLKRASVIREVQAEDNSKLIFEELLPLMGVDFVKLGMLTVIPFPFKYLREYARTL